MMNLNKKPIHLNNQKVFTSRLLSLFVVGVLLSACGLGQKALENRREQDSRISSTNNDNNSNENSSSEISLTSGLISSYDFNDLSGAIAKDNQGSIHGVLQGTDTVLGKSGNGLDFTQSTDRVTMPFSSKHSVSNITVSAWIKWTGPNSSVQRIIERPMNEDGTLVAYNMIINGSGQIVVNAHISGSQKSLTTGIFTPAGQWINVVFTYDGQNITFYINGQLASSKSAIGVLNGYSDSYGLSIGNQYFADSPFNGSIDSVKIWNRALNRSEVASLH